MKISELLIPTFTQMLGTLSAWLEKSAAHAQERGEDDIALLSSRIAADMYPLSSQIRFVCIQAQEPLHRLTGSPCAPHIDVLRADAIAASPNGETVADARGLLDEARAAVEGADCKVLDGAADRSIVLDLPNGMSFDMTGEQYVRDWCMPQFYFHLVTAYAIMRGRGVELGKADYVPHMYSYLRRDA